MAFDGFIKIDGIEVKLCRSGTDKLKSVASFRSPCKT